MDIAIFKHTYKYEILKNDKTFLTDDLLGSDDHSLLKHYSSKGVRFLSPTAVVKIEGGPSCRQRQRISVGSEAA